MSDDSKRPQRGKPRQPGRKSGDGGSKRPFGKPSGAKPSRGFSAGLHRRDASGQSAPPARRDGSEGSERIAKRLARAGVASRRAAEEMIEAGRVKVNGRVLSSPAVNVSMSDRIEIDDQPIPAIERTRLFLFHKPSDTVTTNRDPEGRRTIFDILPSGLPRLISVGRLDINTEGLLLLTNDGGLARALELPSTGWLRRYRVRVHGKVDEARLAELKEGIAVEGVYYGSIEASLDRVQGSNAWLTIGLREGKNREVKNVLGALGLDVTRLIRVSYGPFQLGELAEGELKEIRGATLRDQLGAKLIEQAGANFDAPVLKPFSGKTQTVNAPKEKAAETKAPASRKPRREDRRAEALDRLQTKPKHGAGDKGKRRDEPRGRDKPAGPAKPEGHVQRSRGTHVWMAPGARPLGEKKKAEKAERSEGRRYAGKPRPSGKPRPGGKPPRRK